MSTFHKDITEANLHQPKGVSTAAVDTVYVANGAGSGTWEAPPFSTQIITAFPDVSSAGSRYSVSSVTGTIDKIWSVLHGAITANDSTLTFFINGVQITGSQILVPFTGSAAGNIQSSTPTGTNTVVPGDLITFTTDGLSSTAQPLTVIMRVKV